MSERCEIQVAGLPVIDSCPPDDALFFTNNVPEGLGEFGYAQFTWLMIKNCILAAISNSYTPKFFQFKTLGDELTYIITPESGYLVVDDSVNITLDGSELARYDADTEADERIMYTVVYEGDGTATINFFNAGLPIPAGQVMIIKYGEGFTTNEAPTYPAYWGWLDSDVNTETMVTNAEGSGAFALGAALVADFRANTEPKYLYALESIEQPIRTTWFGSVINYGVIDGSDVFRFNGVLVVGADSYNVYISNFLTEQSTTEIEFRA